MSAHQYQRLSVADISGGGERETEREGEREGERERDPSKS
ncbi:hypothetical protein KIPB_000837, partial [Kipferlia bialata]|eukprot:g837.t1